MSSPTACSKQGQLWDQAGLLRILASCGLKNSKDGDYTTAPGNLLQCLIFLAVICIISLYPVGTSWTVVLERSVSFHLVVATPSNLFLCLNLCLKIVKKKPQNLQKLFGMDFSTVAHCQDLVLQAHDYIRSLIRTYLFCSRMQQLFKDSSLISFPPLVLMRHGFQIPVMEHR